MKREDLIEYALSAGLNEQEAELYAEHMLNPVIAEPIKNAEKFCDSLYEELKNGDWDYK
jgi:hypothetical protein